MNIDPLDVTKVFIKRNDELIIKVVLVNYRELILGVVCILSIDTLFIAAEGVGAFKLDHSSGSSFQNAYPISVVRVDNMQTWFFVGTRSYASLRMDDFVKTLPDYKLLSMVSQLKLCFVVEDKTDGYLRLARTSEWDKVAVHVVVL